MDLDRIFKAYDVRGRYPQEIDEEVAHRVGRAFVQLFGARRLLVARDMRISSEPLSTALISGAAAQGADVIDLGLAATDLLYFASGRLGLPGAVVTASHNPGEYNGIKLCREGALPVGDETGLRDVKALVAAGEFERPPRLGSIERRDVTEEYVEHVLSLVDGAAFSPLRLVIDGGNGMAGTLVPHVFRRLPVEVIPLYFEPDGSFPHHPADPIQPENLKDLQAAVIEHGAGAGMAFDGDADRVFFCDERGDLVSGSLTAALVARAILERHPGEKALYSLTCSRVVPETIRECGGEPIRTRVGHSFMKQVMAETGAIYGGEHSGHYYFREHYRADSGIVCALHVLEVLSKEGRPFSEVLAPYRRYWQSGEVNSEVEDKAGAIERIATAFAGGEQDRMDGLTVQYPEWWFNVRPSNTEPLLRLNVEARDPAEGVRRRDEILALIRS